ncbi:hypothetical protein MNBD_GAMMA13-641 [hydrothermal vent metagenome]|uniref:YfdX protein n=1 Tax=hydrothermal vent metagenome TaxID=652676 RepID=A0A3B0Z904_9ZZZZ
MHTSAKNSAATLLLLATTTLGATAVMATVAPTPAASTTAMTNKHATLSHEQQQIQKADALAQEGRGAMSYIVAAHRLLSEQHSGEALQYLEQARDLLVKLKPEVSTDEGNIALLPIYSQLGVKEGVEITDQLKYQLGKTHLDAVRGNHKKVIETLKAVDVELQYSFVDLPVTATLEKVESAIKALSTKDIQQASQALVDVQKGLIQDSIIVNAVNENPAG